MEAGWQCCDPACVRTSAAHGHQPTHTDCVVLSSGQRCGCSLPILETLLYFLWWQRACTLVSGDGSVPEPLAGLEGRGWRAGLEGRGWRAGLEGRGWRGRAGTHRPQGTWLHLQTSSLEKSRASDPLGLRRLGSAAVLGHALQHRHQSPVTHVCCSHLLGVGTRVCCSTAACEQRHGGTLTLPLAARV